MGRKFSLAQKLFFLEESEKVQARGLNFAVIVQQNTLARELGIQSKDISTWRAVRKSNRFRKMKPEDEDELNRLRDQYAREYDSAGGPIRPDRRPQSSDIVVNLCDLTIIFPSGATPGRIGAVIAAINAIK